MTQITEFTTTVSQVRLLIADLDDEDQVLNDEAITAVLALHDQNVWLAASSCLLSIAVNEVLVQKRIKLGDLSTDGPAEAAQLKALALEYKTRALESDGAGFDWAEAVLTPGQFWEDLGRGEVT